MHLLEEVLLLLGSIIIITRISSNILPLKSIQCVVYVWRGTKRFICIISFYRAVYLTSIHSFDYYLWCTSDVVDIDEVLGYGGETSTHIPCFR